MSFSFLIGAVMETVGILKSNRSCGGHTKSDKKASGHKSSENQNGDHAEL
jgi:hypothetical protein